MIPTRTLTALAVASCLALMAPATHAKSPAASAQPAATPAPVLLQLPIRGQSQPLAVDERVLAGLAVVIAQPDQDPLTPRLMARQVAVLHALLGRLPDVSHQEAEGIATPAPARDRAALAAAAEKLSGQPSARTIKTLKSWKPASLSSAQLQALWPRSQGLAPAEGASQAERMASARRLVVLAPAAGLDVSAGPAITVADLLDTVDVQGRALLQQGDTAFAKALATQLLRQRLALRQLREEESWSQAQIDALAFLLQERQALADRQLALGLTQDPHHGSAYLSKLLEDVTPQDIARHYDAHPEDYRKAVAIEWVSAQCQPETRPCMAGLRSAVDRGVSLFSLWSGAPVPPEGALLQHWRWTEAGGIQAVPHPSGRALPVPELPRDWLLQLALAQPEREASALVRLPGAPSLPMPGGKAAPATAAASSASVYVQVMDRAWGQHPLDSETVRHLARQAVAKDKLQAQWQAWVKAAEADAVSYLVGSP